MYKTSKADTYTNTLITMATTARLSVRFLLPSHVLKCGLQPWHDAVPDQQVAVGLWSACGRGPDHEEEEEENVLFRKSSLAFTSHGSS